MKTGIYFDKNTWEDLTRFADDHGLSISYAVRFCVNEYLKSR